MNIKAISNGEDFFFMGYICYFCDTGITADSVKELFNKIDWCKSVDIYTDRVPLQGHTIHALNLFTV